jgi:hypothetical protein
LCYEVTAVAVCETVDHQADGEVEAVVAGSGGQLGAEPDGLTSAQARRIVADIDAAADVVGFTIAEFFPRQVMHLRQILDGFPLISGTATTR